MLGTLQLTNAQGVGHKMFEQYRTEGYFCLTLADRNDMSGRLSNRPNRLSNQEGYPIGYPIGMMVGISNRLGVLARYRSESMPKRMLR